MQTQNILPTAATAILLAMVSLSSPISAGERSLDTSGAGETQTTLEAPVVDMVAEQDTSEKKPKKVQMTNLANGEVGCHNNETQTSTPGGCWD